MYNKAKKDIWSPVLCFLSEKKNMARALQLMFSISGGNGKCWECCAIWFIVESRVNNQRWLWEERAEETKMINPFAAPHRAALDDDHNVQFKNLLRQELLNIQFCLTFSSKSKLWLKWSKEIPKGKRERANSLNEMAVNHVRVKEMFEETSGD